MDKKLLSERDICYKYITPAMLKAGWNLQTQIREDFNFEIHVLSSSEGENESLRTFLI